MKKLFRLLTVLISLSLIVTGCASKTATTASGTNQEAAKPVKLVVGATPVPHAEILNFVKPLLKEKGIDLEIKEFTDYVTPNVALNDKQIDANFFQHVPYMEDFAKQKNMQLVAAVKVHVEPMGFYSTKIKSADELKDGAKIALPNDATNEGRALLLLQKHGLIKLKDSSNLSSTPRDIAENPKNLKFEELEAAQLPRVLQDVDGAVINTNFALDAKLNPVKDALFIEDGDSPYANVLTVRPDNQNSPAIQELVKALNSDEVKNSLMINIKVL
jgi:D-methionine transport system substrate-binding protein